MHPAVDNATQPLTRMLFGLIPSRLPALTLIADAIPVLPAIEPNTAMTGSGAAAPATLLNFKVPASIPPPGVVDGPVFWISAHWPGARTSVPPLTSACGVGSCFWYGGVAT